MLRKLPSVVVALATAFAALAPCHAQPVDKKTQSPSWEAFVDDPDVKAYLAQLKTGTIDATGRATLTTIVLPLLEDRENVGSLERLRRRIREGLLSERALDAASLDKINGEAAKWALSRVAVDGINPVAAVNAMLLVGELRAKDGKPWPGATPLLATTAADTKLPMAVRAAAMAGLVRHAEAGLSLKTEATRLLAVATAAPADGSGEAGDWLASRALGLLPLAMPDASPEAAGLLVKVLIDASRSVDVRVRAAEALGRMAAVDAKIDASAALEGIRATAIRGLEQDLDAARDAEFGLALSGGGLAMAGGFGGGEFAGAGGMRPDFGIPPGGGPAVPAKPAPAVEPTVLERDAWRLAALASAVQLDGKGRGIALVAGDNARAAQEFAALLKKTASNLHERIHPKPDESAKKQGTRKPAVAGVESNSTPGGETSTQAPPTKQELGQTLAKALESLKAAVRPANGPVGSP